MSGFLAHLLYDLGQSLLLCVLIFLLRQRGCSTQPHMLRSCYCDPGGSPGSALWTGLQVGMEESQLAVPRMWNIWGMSLLVVIIAPARTCGYVGRRAGLAGWGLTLGRLKDSDVEIALLGALGAATPSRSPPFSTPPWGFLQ